MIEGRRRKGKKGKIIESGGKGGGGLKKKEGRAMDVGSGCGRMRESRELCWKTRWELGEARSEHWSGCLNPPCYCRLTSQAEDC